MKSESQYTIPFPISQVFPPFQRLNLPQKLTSFLLLLRSTLLFLNPRFNTAETSHRCYFDFLAQDSLFLNPEPATRVEAVRGIKWVNQNAKGGSDFR
ncbi:hypothetical protein COLO4_37419 [Corchorus olitorius]|uniref:Uncharacterized protein n=1 Tax=Corchorus olitorius TaxID=93759 RepID=A0A1R3G1Z6_9ROSI|nr:hypothetical protein COLO4_37419 [Corchorus olitorius]